VESPDGKFIGVVVALMDAAHFGSVFFENARFNDDVSISLAHQDSRVLARSPFFVQSFGTDASGTDLFRHLRQAPAGTYRATSLVDRHSRIYSYRALDHWPLIVSVGISSQAWNKALMKDLAIGAAGVSLMAIVMLLCGRFALKSFSRIEQSESKYRQLYSQIRAAEAKLSNSENFLRTITDKTPAWIAYRDADPRYRFACGSRRRRFAVRVERRIVRQRKAAVADELAGAGGAHGIRDGDAVVRAAVQDAAVAQFHIVHVQSAKARELRAHVLGGPHDRRADADRGG
jgi:hypothetical protein